MEPSSRPLADAVSSLPNRLRALRHRGAGLNQGVPLNKTSGIDVDDPAGALILLARLMGTMSVGHRPREAQPSRSLSFRCSGIFFPVFRREIRIRTRRTGTSAARPGTP
ncbi:hypothetical protein A605_01195 [Corynebacterium halotolerans YIM 70093 = DSM 44683]|uniref:Uncharacterized protein n=1 Tax=Corynebacterium halotolerans YIM 70093 = DSM 44683 TaxID=1121362 RepID=M1NIK2_9CORY|nr:hypothetical protein A605_01195 [Corynebacterium halotolerans YIM 70093 = DSM 44683]